MKLIKSIFVALVLVALCAPSFATAKATETEMTSFGTFVSGHEHWYCVRFITSWWLPACKTPAPEAAPADNKKAAKKDEKSAVKAGAKADAKAGKA